VNINVNFFLFLIYKVVIESNQKYTVQPTYNPLEILKNESNYSKLQLDSDVVMYPIANFYRLSIDDESETEYTANNSSSSSIVNSNLTSSSLKTDEDTIESKYIYIYLNIFLYK